ncbi:hypothetical protein SAMN02910265_00912 [Ruminococcus flavefaciens]|uniref:DUF3592 domain-containing protein n=2 Tax=Ruminococcus flavefaciens TaxID=1265 RepID=A0A1H6IEC0_RUMFL|nr:hypothetical protein SAMN02910265_00912 [Ruminococcus flavefaciens]
MEEYLLWKFVLLIPTVIALVDYLVIRMLRRKCTETVRVMIKRIGVNSDGTEKRKLVYEYDDRLYESTSDSNLIAHLERSGQRIIKVNPNNPEMYYCPSRQKKHLFTDLLLAAIGIYLVTHINF